VHILKRIGASIVDILIPTVFVVWKGDIFFEYSEEVFMIWLWCLYLFFISVFLITGSRGTYGDILFRVEYLPLKPESNLKVGIAKRNLLQFCAIVISTIRYEDVYLIVVGLTLSAIYLFPIILLKGKRYSVVDIISGVAVIRH